MYTNFFFVLLCRNKGKKKKKTNKTFSSIKFFKYVWENIKIHAHTDSITVNENLTFLDESVKTKNSFEIHSNKQLSSRFLVHIHSIFKCSASIKHPMCVSVANQVMGIQILKQFNENEQNETAAKQQQRETEQKFYFSFFLFFVLRYFLSRSLFSTSFIVLVLIWFLNSFSLSLWILLFRSCVLSHHSIDVTFSSS